MFMWTGSTIEDIKEGRGTQDRQADSSGWDKFVKNSEYKVPDGAFAIGINVGTTFSSVAVYRRNMGPAVLENEQGDRLTPSVVAFTDREMLIGEPAVKRGFFSGGPPLNRTIYETKRLIGRSFDDHGMAAAIKDLSYQVYGKSGKPYIRTKAIGGRTVALFPEQITAVLLGRMKELAEAYLGVPVSHAVVTVPTRFTDAQRRAMRLAGEVAGLNMRLVNEPTAAALAYTCQVATSGASKTILVYNLGGGAFDVSVIDVQGGVLQVLASRGNTSLGGRDINRVLVEHFTGIARKKVGTQELKVDDLAKRKLQREVERAKRDLSEPGRDSTVVEVPEFTKGFHLSGILTRERFEALTGPVYDATMVLVRRVLADAGVGKDDIHDVVLVGGSTRIPKIRKLLHAFFNKPPFTGINPDEAAVVGAAMEAALMTNQADDALADALLLDVAPHAVGLKLKNGDIAKKIQANTPLLVPVTHEFTTADDNQPNAVLELFEVGEDNKAAQNHRVGTYVVEGIHAAPARVPMLLVKMWMDRSGILQLAAEDAGLGKRLNVKADYHVAWSEYEITRLVKEYTAFKEHQLEVLRKELIVDKMEACTNMLANEHASNDRTQKAVKKASTWMEANFDALSSEWLSYYEIELKSSCEL
eukprot:jgi/Mesvir1/16193/Mv08456-RA.2